MKYSDELKRKMLEDVLVQHKRVCDVARQNGFPVKYLHRLVGRARESGIDSCMHSNRKGRYSDDFKLEVVRYIGNGHSFSGAGRRFGILREVASIWYRKYAQGGVDALSSADRRQTLEQDNTEDIEDRQKGRRRVHTEKEYRELEKRLRHAELENKFLKKLDALVQERIERERKR